MRKIIRWFMQSRLLILQRRIFKNFMLSSGISFFYIGKENFETMKMIMKVKDESNMLIGGNEAYHIYQAVKSTERIKGELVEVGVYNGGSAKVICEAKGDRPLHLFDTFTGMPKIDEIDSSCVFEGLLFASFEKVKDYLKGYKNVNFYKGVFPDTAGPIKNKKFSFVNLDVDTYRGTLNCLKFFYPRVTKGGIIISHDYASIRGVRKAFDEFFEDKPEPVIEMSGSQCLVMKF